MRHRGPSHPRVARATGALLLAGAVALPWALPAYSQSPLTSGVRGRVIIAKELLETTDVPVDAEAGQPWYATAANARRRAGRGVLGPVTAPAPELLVVLEGEKPQSAEARAIRFTGLRFVPSSILVPRPARLKVYNDERVPITVTSDGVSETIEPKGSAFVEVPVGAHALRVREYSFVKADVLVLEKAIVLPVKADGLIDPVLLEPADYRLGFYWGATPWQVQDLTIPDGKLVAIDASVSANRVVTVSVKDGGLQVATPPSPRPTPSPPGDDAP